MGEMDLFSAGHGIVLSVIALLCSYGVIRALVSVEIRMRGVAFDRRHNPVIFTALVMVYAVLIVVMGLWAYEDGARLFDWPTLDLPGMLGEPPQD